MANKQPNIEGLLNHAQKKKKKAFEKVDQSIKQLIKQQQRINFNVVAQRAGVSKAFLYKEKVIRNRIEMLRAQQEGLSYKQNVKRNISDPSKDVIIGALKSKINELEGKNRELELENTQLKNQMKKN